MTKEAKKAPLLKQQPWTGEWVDPAAMFSAKPDFSRAGKPKTTVTYQTNKVAAPIKKLPQRPWTGNLVEYTQKLVAKGKPYVAPSMEKVAPTTNLRFQQSWIGSAADSLIQGTADSMKYLTQPQPKKKMWITSGDPNAPWNLEKKTKALTAGAMRSVGEAMESSVADAVKEVTDAKVPEKAEEVPASA
eukprot:CAMPEP_0184483058 /NCGR_PEP_ID=MMETSP0113_2-20130426/4660_1 /TAXON_ID=91329 /ORGANISM="Norrisiella sphaerica, Strain BC52" /LENGTH=187 /DNA_ID=CAMNT_0026863189 /DNA_START=295 /DNA_END=858 /DNA_ORIENTATION=+